MTIEGASVGSISEEYTFLAEHRCNCGGEWAIISQKTGRGGDCERIDILHACCMECESRCDFVFAFNGVHAAE